VKTARQRAFIQTRSMRPERRRERTPTQLPVAGAALQVFVSRVAAFLGTELFSGDRTLEIGRHRDCLLRLDDDSVSRRHCRLSLEGKKVYVEDLGSSNGTLVNQQHIDGKVEVLPTDSIHIGSYTLKVRALVPNAVFEARPTSGISEKTTRLKAILSADGAAGTEDHVVDLGKGVDWRLYEAAVRRATGARRAVSPIPLVVVPGGRADDGPTDQVSSGVISDEVEERESTQRDPSVIEAVAQPPDPRTAHGLALGPRAGQRMAEIERAMRRLDTPEDSARAAAPRRRETDLEALGRELREMSADAFSRYLAAELGRGVAAAERPDTAKARAVTPLARSFSDPVPSDRMSLEDAFEVDTQADAEEPEIAAEPVLSAVPTRVPTPAPRARRAPTPRPAVQAAPPVAPSRQESVTAPAPPPPVRARRVPVGRELSVPPAIVVPAAAQATEQVRARGPVVPGRSIAARSRLEPVTPNALRLDREPSAVPRAPMGMEPQLSVRARSPLAPVESTPEPLPPAALTPLGETTNGTPCAVPREAIPARLVTPTDMKVAVGPAPASGPTGARVARRVSAPEPAWTPIDSDEILEELSDADFTESVEAAEVVPEAWEAVEIAAREDGRLLDIATLRHPGEQYVLGHRTPQGVRAPHVCHTGLRLLRITDDRNVDLVFPADAAGQLIRDGESVPFGELSQGRKYSCLRLVEGDIATVLLREAGRQIAYHVRFARRFSVRA
jgi:hypothetical protein